METFTPGSDEHRWAFNMCEPKHESGCIYICNLVHEKSDAFLNLNKRANARKRAKNHKQATNQKKKFASVHPQGGVCETNV
jgi:hypothetical protein